MFRFRPSSMDTRCLLNWTFDRLAVDTFRRRSVLDLG